MKIAKLNQTIKNLNDERKKNTQHWANMKANNVKNLAENEHLKKQLEGIKYNLATSKESNRKQAAWKLEL